MVLYPSEEWLVEYRRALNDSQELQDFGFSENILLIMTDMGLEEITIGDLGEGALGDVPRSVCEDLADVTLGEAVSLIDGRVRSSLPDGLERLLDQTEHAVVDDTIYIYMELDDGHCQELSLVRDPSDLDPGSIFRAPASTWQGIVAGRPAIAAAMRGDLEVIGNEFMRLKYLAELQLISDIATSDVDTEFLFAHEPRSLCAFVFDESLRPSIELQKLLTRQTALTVRTFMPF